MKQQLFSDEIVNKRHIEVLDLCKTVLIIFMICTHVFESLADGPAKNSFISYIICMFSISFGASAFMFYMGITFNYSRKLLPRTLFKRGLLFFSGGYVLNVAENITTIIYSAIHGTSVYEAVKTFFIVDILAFAGCCMMLFALFLKLKLGPLKIFVISAAMSLAALIFTPYLPFFSDSSLDTFSTLLTACISGLFYFSSNEATAFPLFIWLIIPAAGYFFGYYFIRCRRPDKMMRITCLASAGLITVISICILVFRLPTCIISYSKYQEIRGIDQTVLLGYGQKIWDSLLLIAIAAFITSLFYFVSDKIPVRMRKPLYMIASNVTIIYVIQWLLIGNIEGILACTGKLTLAQTIFTCLLILAAAAIITGLYLATRKKIKKGVG